LEWAVAWQEKGQGMFENAAKTVSRSKDSTKQ